MKTLALIAAIVWAAPWSLLGLLLGAVGLATGGRAQRVGRIIEFHGGAVAWILERAPIVCGAAAMTLGHVVLGRTRADLDYCRKHELVHVRQYERWGPLFIPAYLGASFWLWLRGRDSYRENPFERQAFEEAP